MHVNVSAIGVLFADGFGKSVIAYSDSLIMICNIFCRDLVGVRQRLDKIDKR